MQLAGITPLHLKREWNRLLKSGGHARRTKAPRPMSAKTVRNIAGALSSAFNRAVRWGLITANPVTASEPPIPKKHKGVALPPKQQSLVFAMAGGPWCLSTFLEMSAATRDRRGELLAVRWSDICDGRVTIARSLTQTKKVLEFKCTKEGAIRVVTISASPWLHSKSTERSKPCFARSSDPTTARISI